MSSTASNSVIPSPVASIRPAAESNSTFQEDTEKEIPAENCYGVQLKLSVGDPDDPLEKEADDTADQVLRMSDQVVLDRARQSSIEQVQRDEDSGAATSTGDEASKESEKLNLQLTEPDFLALRGPFFQRNAMHLWDPDSALGVWQYNLNFFKRLGFNEEVAGKAANFTAPLFIDSQLKAKNPTWWEDTDRLLNTSSIVAPALRFTFDPNFRNWHFPLLQKKAFDSPSQNLTNYIQRKCKDCEEEEKAQRKPLVASKTPFIQTKSNSKSFAPDAVSQSIESSRGKGSALDPSTRSFMSDRFGNDFSEVRLHTDSTAIQLNRDLNARAFTTGNDIFFNSGQYKPETTEGKRLLAHELTHTIQQGSSTLQRKYAPYNKGHREKSFIQLKCAHCEEEEKQQKKIMRKQLGDNPGPPLIQLKPGKDQKADNGNIKYPEVTDINKGNWKEYGFNYINIFKHKGYNPTDTPNAYANEVYKLQEAIISLTPEADRTKFPIVANGVLGLSTINWLTDFGVEAEKDPASRSLFIKYGIDKDILEKFAQIGSKNVPVEPLLSRDFNGHELFHLINMNRTFLLTLNDQNGAVKILQQVLIRLNYNIGDKGADGIFGQGTVNALKAFQVESGMKKWEADGNLGYKTLRKLDKRISTAAYDYMVSIPGGNVRVFKVSMPRLMTREEKLVHSIVEIFGISEKDALELTNNKDNQNKWNWLEGGFKDTTPADLNRGYEIIGVPVKDYDSIVTTIKQKGYSYKEPVEPKLKELSIELSGFEKIFLLNKDIEALENKKSGILSQAVDPFGAAKNNLTIDREIAAKKKERAAELARLNISEDIYKAKGEEFKKLFATYAVKVAMQMLDKNEKDASLEMIRYSKSNDPDALEQGVAIKNIFTRLDEVWSRAEKEWWQGISVAQGASPDEITNESSLNTYLINKKGMRRRCTKGDCIEPSETVLPSYQYTKFQKREGNSYFIKAYDSNIEAHKYLTEAAKEHRVLAYPKLELRANISKYKELSPEAIEDKLLGTSSSIKENIKKTRLALRESPTNVYKLKPVIELAKYQLGIFPETIQDSLIKDAIKQYEDAEFWRNIGMAALGLGLGLLALVSGPVGWAALGAGIVVGGIDAYLLYQDITFTRTSANTAFDPAKALSDVEPGYFWFYVSVAFIGLDVFQGLKAIGAVARAAKATEEGSQLAFKLINAMNEDKKALQELIAQGGENVAELAAQLKKLQTAINNVDAAKMAKQMNVLKHLNDIPQAVLRLSGSLEDPKVLKAFETMDTLLKQSGHTSEVYKDVLKFYAGPGNDFISELPELIRLAEKADLATKPQLLKELLTNPKSQKVMLDFGENQDQFVKLWSEWATLKAAGKAPTFAEHLKAKGFVTDLKPTKTLVEQLGTEFASQPLVTKNLQVLRTIEDGLADAFSLNKLPKKIQDSLAKILESDIIGDTANLARAQERMKHSLRLLGATIESASDYQAIIRLIKNTDAKMAFFQKATSLAGHEEYIALFTKYSKELAANPNAMDEFLRIGPFTDDETFKWLLGNGKIRKLIADNPALVRALKKCASPCFPIHADVEDIEKILKAIQDGGEAVDYAKLNQYMYLNRPRNTTAAEMSKWKSAVDNLANDLKGTMKGVEMPKGSEIPLPPRFQAGGATPLKDAARKLDVLIKRGFAPKQLEDILVQANINKLDANEFLEQLSRATNKLGARPLDNISGIINGLSSTNPQKFETAYHFMRRIGDYSTGAGVDLAERIFSVFDINEITKLRYSSSARLSADVAKATGDVSVAGIELFGTLVARINGSSEDIIRLAAKAGGGETDIVKLASIVDNMGQGSHSLAAVEARIIEAQQLTAKIAAAGDDMGDAIWGTTKSADKWRVGKMFIDEASGKVSGSRAIAYIKGKGDSIVSALLDSTGNLDPAKWKIFRKTIADTDLAGPIKNHIIGEMWDKANVGAYRKVFGNDNVVTQVTIRIKGTETEAVIDAVIKSNGEVLFKEFKSGEAVLSAAQKKVYELMKQGRTDLLEPLGEKAAQVWPDTTKFKAAAVEVVEESSIP